MTAALSSNARVIQLFALASLAGCVETIDVSLTVRVGERGPGENPCARGEVTNLDAVMNSYIITTYEPINGTCCVPSLVPSLVPDDPPTVNNPCPDAEMRKIEERCVEGPDDIVTPASVNRTLVVSGVRIENWDPDRKTCVRVIGMLDVTKTNEESRVVNCKSYTAMDWQTRLDQSLRLCGQTAKPVTGTGLVSIEPTHCARPDTKDRALAMICAKLGSQLGMQ